MGADEGSQGGRGEARDWRRVRLAPEGCRRSRRLGERSERSRSKHPGEKLIEGRVGRGSVPWGPVRGCGRLAFFAGVLEDMRPVES